VASYGIFRFPKTIELNIEIASTPSSKARLSKVNPIANDPTHVASKYPAIKFTKPHHTLSVGLDRPFPGGCANGVGNFCPDIPFTKCGTLFARNAPAKKYTM